MKTRSSSALLAAVLGATLVCGSPAIAVLQTPGRPAEKLDQDVWLYRHFDAGTAQPRHDSCDTLMVTFLEGRVRVSSIAT